MSYQQFASKTTSEKLTAAWVEPSQRVVAGWSVYSGSIYVAAVQFWVVNVLVGGATLVQRSSLAAVDAGSFFFDPLTKLLYVQLADNSSPKLSHTEVVYRLFFADGPVDLPFDLGAGRTVPYLPYLSQASNGGSRFDPNSPQIPIEGSGKLNLQNDGTYFNQIFDRLNWQTKRAAVFSVSRDGDTKKLYEGLISGKSFNGTAVSFSLKDQLFKLRSQIDLPLYSEADGRLSDSLLGKPKRRIYGRVAGLKAESVDQQLDGYLVVGIAGDDTRTTTARTFSLTTGSDKAIASHVDAKQELCANDRITINEVDFKVKTLSRREFNLTGEKDITFSQPVSASQLRISFADMVTTGLTTAMCVAVSRLANGTATLNTALYGVSPIVAVGATYVDVQLRASLSVGTVVAKVAPTELCIVTNANDTQFQLSEVSQATKTDLTARVKPVIPYRRLNRTLSLSHHALHEVAATVTKVKRGTLFELSTVEGLSIGDYVVFNSTKVTRIASLDPYNKTVGTVNAVNPLPQNGESVVRVAVQSVTFSNLEFTPLRDYSVSNGVGGASCTLSTTAEREVASGEAAGNIVWQANSKVVVGTGAFDEVHPRDWIRPTAEADWYEVEEVFGSGIAILKAPYVGTSGTKPTTVKKPTYIGDKSNVLIDTYGITFDGTPTGTLVRTAPDAVRHLMVEAGLADIDSSSFEVASSDAPYLVSYCIPLEPRGKAVTFREALDDLNKSVLGVTFVSESFTFKYKALSAQRSASSATYVTDFDVIDYKQSADSSTIYRKIVAQYRHQDLDRISEEKTFLVAEQTSSFVDSSGIEGQALTVDLFLYNTADAEILARRLMFFNELPKTELQIVGKLNLSSLFLTDLVLFRADNLYARYGSTDSAIVGIVTSAVKSGQGVTLTVADLGNIFSRAAVIAPNGTPSFAEATLEQKRFAGFITDEGGVIESDDEVGTNLIS